MPKRKKSKNGYSETGVLLENIESQVRVIAEQTSQIPEINKKIGRVEDAIEVMKMDIETIKHGFKIKVDIDEFAALEKRVSKLESRL